MVVVSNAVGHRAPLRPSGAPPARSSGSWRPGAHLIFHGHSQHRTVKRQPRAYRAACVTSCASPRLQSSSDWNRDEKGTLFQNEVRAFRAIVAGTALGAAFALSGLLYPRAACASQPSTQSLGQATSSAAVTAVLPPQSLLGHDGAAAGPTLEDSDTAITRANRVTAAQWAQYKARDAGRNQRDRQSGGPALCTCSWRC